MEAPFDLLLLVGGEAATLELVRPLLAAMSRGVLHLGYYDPEGRLQYAGGVGTGFDDG